MPITQTDKLPGLQNMAAFLDTLAYSEGTDNGSQLTNNHGYDVLVMGKIFTSYADHPRIKVYIPKYDIYSTAAGRYQLLARYYDIYKVNLKLKDFSPESQDAIAIQQIKERGAIDDIKNGKLQSAISKCCNIWASLPGANYGQQEQQYETLKNKYISLGGAIF